ncbi:hypothetical protein FO519_000614 [Halicephalobus sp. NKZ332]|nr:hypothetical protein FO519_000614 [Halicephalobus sp. NKZ332]
MVSSSLKVLALCALLTLGQGQGGPFDQPCDMNVFQNCANTLGEFLGTSYIVLFNDLFLFDGLYNKFVSATGPSDVATMCNALTTFYSCLDPTFEQCLSPLGWVNQGKSPAQAFLNDGILRQYTFICGAGFQLLNEPVTFNCIQTTYRNNYDALVNQTLRVYMNSVAYDPANSCKYAETLQTSWAAIISNTTCFQNKRQHVASFFGCGAALEYTSAQFRHCMHQNTCAWAANWTNVMKYLKSENGVTYLRVPAHPEQDKFGEWFQAEEKWIPLKM